MVLQLSLLAGITIIHVLASRMRFLQGIPRSIWLSIAGGASVAYIFLHLIPELIEARESFQLFDHELSVFFVALAGLCFIYGMEKLAKRSAGTVRTFWVHIISYSMYNFIIGHLMINKAADEEIVPLLLFFVAMGLHFIVDDYGLLYHHEEKYLHTGRWLISGAVFSGGIAAMFFEVSEQVLYGGIAFISGGIIMNVLKEELPENRKSRYWAFLLGAGLYSTLLFYLNEAE
jgi:hypothetical protein